MTLIPYRLIGEPEDVVKAAAWLASETKPIMSWKLFIDGGMTIHPGFGDQRLTRQPDRGFLVLIRGKIAKQLILLEMGSFPGPNPKAADGTPLSEGRPSLG